MNLWKEVCHHGTFDGIFEVGIVEDDERWFSAKLQSYVSNSDCPYLKKIRYGFILYFV